MVQPDEQYASNHDESTKRATSVMGGSAIRPNTKMYYNA